MRLCSSEGGSQQGAALIPAASESRRLGDTHTQRFSGAPRPRETDFPRSVPRRPPDGGCRFVALRRGTGPPFQSISSCRKRVDFALGGFREVVPRARGRLCVGVGLCVGVRELTHWKGNQLTGKEINSLGRIINSLERKANSLERGINSLGRKITHWEEN